jgi:alkanesulfonate monooxygenase SsuD/methylene tetrahydromethanopterin reductase-like flavin-dependent oxidoreductase (luciferase family)
MKFGIFYEHQLPRPWEEGSEHKLLKDALDQVELADKLGIDYVWEVEHHFLEEYSHSSAPEVFLAACSQRTSRIRIGHGIVATPPGYNHPARVAERISTLDLISDGRVDFGTGETSSESELGGFGVDRATKREQWNEALDVITRLMVETPFAGYAGEYVQMPIRNMIPKPFQKPHPPLWVACSRRETIHLAATKGIGALSFSFIEPSEAKAWVDDYYATIQSEECVPGGFSVNPNVAVVLPMMCHADEETAIERGLDGGHFFGYSLGHFYIFGTHTPAVTDVYAEFEKNRSLFGFDRNVASQTGQTLGAQLFQQGLGALRGAVGTPEQIRRLLRGYQDAGVDQVIFVSQAGRNQHEHICESLELFADEVMPEFHEHEEAREKAKLERLAPAMEAALTRREPARTADPAYRVGAAMQP